MRLDVSGSDLADALARVLRRPVPSSVEARCDALTERINLCTRLVYCGTPTIFNLALHQSWYDRLAKWWGHMDGPCTGRRWDPWLRYRLSDWEWNQAQWEALLLARLRRTPSEVLERVGLCVEQRNREYP